MTMTYRFLAITLFASVLMSATSVRGNDDATDSYQSKIEPFLENYCISCHDSRREAGGVAFDLFTGTDHATKSRKLWENVQRLVANGEMPPAKRTQPTMEEKDIFLQQLDETLLQIDCAGPKHPGRVTLRRLNRQEYNNTIQDLTGVQLTPADSFPADDVGYGFDNIGDVLSIQPILLEKYMNAADDILNTAIELPQNVKEIRQNFNRRNLRYEPRSARQRGPSRGKVEHLEFSTEGSAWLEELYLPTHGRYEIAVRGYGVAHDDQAAKMAIRLDGKELKTFEVKSSKDKPEFYRHELDTYAGHRRLSIHFVNPDKSRDRKLGLFLVQVIGPLGGGTTPLTKGMKTIIGELPKPSQERAKAREVLTRFAQRAFRRPAENAEVDRLMTLYDLAHEQGQPFEEAIKLPLKAVLVSPNFLYMVEMDPDKETGVRDLNDFELATRLSYFLWSSMPDEALFNAAKRGELQTAKGMRNQISRMLRDPKAQALVRNFAGQWLQLRNLDTVSPDQETFDDWDSELRESMRQETELFFQDIVRNNMNVLTFIDSDFTYLDQTLAQHYGVDGVRGDNFRKVKLSDGKRGGVITQASVLTVTSNPTRTSPVKRGKWVYENILGLSAPPPPPGIPELPPVAELKGTLRQQMEQHRANPNCATCHAKLDPLGFGLENFDGVGRWRDMDNNQKLDVSGVLPDGMSFDGPKELRQILLKKSDLFRKCLAEKLFTYALGRGLEYYDDCSVQEIVKHLKANNDQFHALIEAIVQTDAFRKRKGTRSDS